MKHQFLTLSPMSLPVVVVGAGGGGILAAWSAARQEADVLLLERNPGPGIKILISGGGKCNVTHDGSIDELLAAFLPAERRFLKPSFYSFSNADVRLLLQTNGITTAPRSNGRVFPTNGTARDVVKTLESLLRTSGVRLETNCRVERLLCADRQVHGVVAGGRTIRAAAVVLATGGVSYPKTGTTGDGYRWAEEAGHTVLPLRPALAPIGIDPPLPKEWYGVALRGCRLLAVQGQRTVASWRGDVLFSHEGITGPAALEVSRGAAVAAEHGPVELHIDMFPDKEFQVLEEELVALARTFGARTLETILDPWLPNRLVPDVLRALGIDPHTRGHVLGRADRRAIVGMLKQWHLGRAGCIPIERGEVTAGGVALGEVDPRTMHSRRVRGLFLCGEILDIAGPVGGYNLQAAFSTGYVAGRAAAALAKGNSQDATAVLHI